MLELFVIFSKSGIVLFATVNQTLNQVVNGLVKHVFLEERTGHYQTSQLQIKYHLDNEFDLVYVVGYQKILQLSYVDKFLKDISRAFRNKYTDFDLKRVLDSSFSKRALKLSKIMNQDPPRGFEAKVRSKVSSKQKVLDFCDLVIDGSNIIDFGEEFEAIYQDCVKNYAMAPKQEAMRTFQDSAKSKKTIASMIVTKGSENTPPPSKPIPEPTKPIPVASKPPGPFKPPVVGKLASRSADTKVVKKSKKEASEKKGKAARQWDLSGNNPDEFDFSKKSEGITISATNTTSNATYKNIPTKLEMTDSESSEDDTVEGEIENTSSYLATLWKARYKTLTLENLEPVLKELREHLTRKNVAADIAEEICQSVGQKLAGQNISTWVNLKKFARGALEEAVLGILNQGKNINILREIQAKDKPPYVIVFCGVNGVGKSTNLAKIANWLMQNQVKVLVVACDTFRGGAIEQLKTHVANLKNDHEKKGGPIKIELFERGYGRDGAAIAREGINYARLNEFNCVLVDTAGRMQDNGPLMKELANLIKTNSPDLTLFVGEALVGNEAVDQVENFNKALLDRGCLANESTKSVIDGIVLTKFDTVDDKVGAAISMTYVTARPIVFVGVGQNYWNLKHLDAKAVTKALMR